MNFNGHEVITWSVNDYLGLANNPEVRKIDAEAAKKYGSASIFLTSGLLAKPK
jgi:glycine C-acetyltransferase